MTFAEGVARQGLAEQIADLPPEVALRDSLAGAIEETGLMPTAGNDQQDWFRAREMADKLMPWLRTRLAEHATDALRDAADEAWGRATEATSEDSSWRGVTAWLRQRQRLSDAADA